MNAVVGLDLASHRLLDATLTHRIYASRWQDGSECAYKTVPAHARTEGLIASLHAEAQVLGLLGAVQGVPRLLHLDAAAGWLAETRMPGSKLSSLSFGLLADVPRTIRMAIELARILEGIHEARVFHGDLHPDNILFEPDTESVAVVDFGDAVAQLRTRSVVAGAQRGGYAQAFSAPEQTGRMGPVVDYRADCYSLGAVLYWALSGRAPFIEDGALALMHALLTRTPRPIDEVNPRVGASLGAVVAKLLTKNPEQRYQSMRGLRLDLQSCLARALSTTPGGAPGIAQSEHAEEADFRPGLNDARLIPAAPSRLVGREGELQRIDARIQPLSGATSGAAHVVMVSGYSGTGKSEFVSALAQRWSERGGIVARGRYEPQIQPELFGGLAGALAELAAQGFAEAPKQLNALRQRGLEVLGSNAGVLAHLVPAFAPWLEASGASLAAASEGEVAEGGAVQILERLKQALAGLFDLIRENGAPLLLFIDDLQWADANSLELIESIALDAPRSGIVLIGAYRANEVDPAHPLSGVLAKLRGTRIEAGAGPLELRLDDLNGAAVLELLADVLDEHPQALRELAAALHHKTGGNPFFTLRYVRRLYDEQQLQRIEGHWVVEPRALDALPSSENLVDSLVQELKQLPLEVQQLAVACACLGPNPRAELLARVMGVAQQRIDELLLPLIRSEMLFVTRSVPPSPTRAPSPGDAERGLRFCHDRMQQAAYGLLGPTESAKWHLGFARFLHASGRADDAYAAARHYLAALDDVVDPEEVDRALALLLEYARNARAHGAFENAHSLADGAASLARRAPSADTPLQLQIDLLRHACLYSLARYGDMDVLFARIDAQAQDQPVEVTPAVSLQCLAWAQRLRSDLAIAPLLAQLARLGVAVPAPDEWRAAIAGELDQFYALPQVDDPALFDELPEMQGPALRAACELLVSSFSSTIQARPDITNWSLLFLTRMHCQHGYTELLPYVLALAVWPLARWRKDYATGCRLGQAGDRLLARRPSLWQASRVHNAMAYATHWVQPIEHCIALARQASQEGIESGELQSACFAWHPVLFAGFESHARLDAVAADQDVALQLAARYTSPFAQSTFTEHRRLVNALRRPPHATDAPVPAFARLAPEELVQDEAVKPIPLLRTSRLIQRSLAAVLFGQWDAALVLSRPLLPSDAGGSAGFNFDFGTALCRYVRALSLSHALLGASEAERRPLRAELHPLVSWIERRAADAPANFAHWCELLRALSAWADGASTEAIRAFEASLDSAQRHGRPYHHALACELASEFYAAQGAGRAAWTYRMAALDAYREWGALAKVAQLGGRVGTPLAARSAPGSSPGAGPSGSDPMRSLDMQAIAQASEMLSTQRHDPDVLPQALFELVRHYAAAERGLLFWRSEDSREGGSEGRNQAMHDERHGETHWALRGGFEAEHQWVKLTDEPAGEASRQSARATANAEARDAASPAPAADGSFGTDALSVPPAVLRHLMHSRRPLVLPDVAQDERYGQDALIHERGIRSIVALPIELHGEVVGLLYLENRMAHTTLSPGQVKTLSVIGLQFAAAYENARIYRDLEHHRGALQAIFDHSPAVVFTKDLEGRYLRHNPRCAEAWGRPGESLVGLTDAQIFDPELVHNTQDYDRQVLATGQAVQLERQVDSPDGRRTLMLTKFPLLDQAGRPYAIGGMAIDITELKRAQLAAEAGTRAKSDFLANMSHEIRTPMNAILGMSYLALQSGLNEQQHDYVQKVQLAAESLLGIINDILDFSKIEAGKLAMEQIDFELGDVMETLAGVVGLKAEQKGLELLFEEPPTLPSSLVGDPMRLGQVLLNLASNAVKFTERGEVVVSIELVEMTEASPAAETTETTATADPIEANPADAGSAVLRFAVQDSGVGISAEQRTQLFRAFSQADASTSRRYGGTGLGLAISQHLVHLMGGEIGVDSVPGRGSIFYFTARFGLQPRAARAAPAPRLDGARVLVVDDNFTARRVMSAMVCALGLQAEAVSAAAQAIEAVSRARCEGRPYELVLLDVKMPGMDGIECARELTRLGDPPPRVLMVTSFGRDEALRRLKALRVKVVDVLTKPVLVPRLIEVCTRVLGQRMLINVVPLRPKSTSVPVEALRGARILLVEDNEVNQQLAGELLKRAGIIVQFAEDGEQALDWLERQSFELVLMDCQMPVMDGYAATRAIRAQPQFAQLPIIAMTANAMLGDRERALEAGMNDHIVKPIKIDAMFATLTRWIAPHAGAEVEAPEDQEGPDAIRLPGLDTKLGLKNALNDEQLYRKLLRLFLKNQQNFAAQFRSARDSGDTAGALRLAHTLRSTAGTLGAIELQERAGALERACALPAQNERIVSLAEQVAQTLDEVLEGLRAYPSPGA